MKKVLFLLAIIVSITGCEQISVKRSNQKVNQGENTVSKVKELPELQVNLKVEPPYWWSGFKNDELQLLLYAPGVARFDQVVTRMNVLQVEKQENENYLFVTLDLSATEPGMYAIHLSNDEERISFQYEIKAREAGSATRKGFDSSDVIYTLMPDRFSDGNPANNNHSEMVEQTNRDFDGGRHGGDIQGIINHVNYIESLGATAVWSTPLLEDNEPVYSYHGYAQSDYYRIDPRYGSNNDYKSLADELHKRDMHLIMDYVTNHWGSKHWIIQDLPQDDWIHKWNTDSTGFQRSNYRMTTQFDPYASEVDKKACMDGWFDTTMPDMNQSNPLVNTYMIQNALWWIEFAGLDGLRVDTYSYNDKDGIAEWTKAIMKEYPDFNIVGEVWFHDTAQISYWQKDSPIASLQDYNSHLPSVMDFTLHDAMNTAFKEQPKWSWQNEGFMRIYNTMANDFMYADVNKVMTFFANHDTDRFHNLYDGDVQAYKLALTLIMTTRGIPQIYYGDEIGMTGKKSVGDGDIRRDFPGGWAGDFQNAFIPSERTEQQNELFNFTSTLLNWRKSRPEIHTGKLTHYVPQDNVYVYFRENDDKKTMIILNNAYEDREVDVSRFRESVPDKIGTVIDVLSKKTQLVMSTITIPARTPMIFELDL